jgi:hypothetical protein
MMDERDVIGWLTGMGNEVPAEVFNLFRKLGEEFPRNQ